MKWISDISLGGAQENKKVWYIRKICTLDGERIGVKYHGSYGSFALDSRLLCWYQ